MNVDEEEEEGEEEEEKEGKEEEGKEEEGKEEEEEVKVGVLWYDISEDVVSSCDDDTSTEEGTSSMSVYV